MRHLKPFLLFSVAALFLACMPAMAGGGKKTDSRHVAWSRNATIYEVNIRQFTPEGTFGALERQLLRLQKMGVGILWLMPVNPLGEKNRKGSLGSYYSVKDYLSVNPEYGTMEDFKRLVKHAHDLGMKVIIDWVANHTSWDNPLITEHPGWYKHNDKGEIVSPVADWTDVAALDYSNRELWKYMNEALAFWVRETDIDGYRCDVAGMMPIEYWNQAIPPLRKIKPLFMLAEDASPRMHDTAFDATYDWDFHHLMNDISKGKKPASQLDTLWLKERGKFPADAYRMLFTSNHDENSWNGTEFERMGSGAEAFAVLTFTWPGIPLVYSGQESAMKRRLRFFDKDTIPWGDYPLERFYSRLIHLKKKCKLLDSGTAGGEFVKVVTGQEQAIYSFLRRNGKEQIFVVLNLSGEARKFTISDKKCEGDYTNLFSGLKQQLKRGDVVQLKPWDYMVLKSY